MNVVEVKNLSKSYKNLKAVDNVSFNVKKRGNTWTFGS